MELTPLKTKQPRKERSFADIKYKTYDPSTEGHGNVHQWRQAFNDRMGYDEAVVVINADDPIIVLGFSSLPDLKELNKQFRKLMMQHHPDRGGDVDKARKIIAAFVLLEKRIKG